MDGKDLLIATYYNPPKKNLNEELFRLLLEKRVPFLVGGDLNANNLSLGNSYDNESGKILEKMTLDHDLNILNDESLTTEKNRLDLFISSVDLSNKFKNFYVDTSCPVKSDHFPIHIELNFNLKIINQIKYSKLNLNKAD